MPDEKVPNDFNLNLNNKTAVYIPFAQAVPKIATIDANYCLHLTAMAKGKDNVCGMCEKVCGAKAINFAAKDEVITEKYGAIVVATGYEMIDLKPYGEYAYGECKDVVSSLEYERLMNASGPTSGHLLRPSDGKPPKKSCSSSAWEAAVRPRARAIHIARKCAACTPPNNRF